MSTKNSVLQALNSLGVGEFLSGEELASSCSVSRTAIWKAIKSLEDDGYKIEAVTNRGYRILSAPDKLDSSKISSLIKESCGAEVKTLAFDEIDSTNSEAKRRAVEVGSFRDAAGKLTEKGKAAHLSLFAAERQTGGKGRLGRTFVSPRDCGVYFSLLYSPRGGVKNPALYTAAAAVSVARAVKKLYGEDSSIKWVNDLFLAGKKICGILVEGIANFETGSIDAAVVGIGINIRKNPELSGEITKIAGSIEEAKSLKGEKMPLLSKNALIAEVVSNLIEFYGAFENEDESKISEMIFEYRNASLLNGKSVTVNPVAGTSGQSYRAIVKDIDEEMRLVVETEAGQIQKLSSGEVSLHSYDFV
ncbi:biotin--[acetyl-CoA-carboxylase] ligase [Treponema ruminis]|uniref:Bifunctional ligase/repressor BirA n=1 Tax=Treponema ruminis TaxID=744515 RepID=A0A7W8G6T4_9SPIR|nr:biotin--[acetyl-CoA-carboxylase] ligase [Treponema ruminis]MBB5224893.1 BirA family biotin operon repressor/biotin-[acetyl-CoA-carboxylase] ligase [Treponema ruminis]